MTNVSQSPLGGLLPPSQLFANTGKALETSPPTAPQITPQPAEAPQTPAPAPAIPGVSQFLAPNAGQARLSVNFVEDPSMPRLHLPPRSTSAVTGSAFWAEVQNMGAPQREQAIKQQILEGNVPDHLREMKPLNLSTQASNGEVLQATVYVTPDYLAIGSSDDYVLVPMSPITGQAIADSTGTTLPTRKLVDSIYQQADIQLRPRPQDPGPQMTSIPYFARHDNTIREQRNNAGAAAGDLIAGHKKDVVITPRLDRKPQAVAIYGWHQSEGNNIQPLSTIHENTYADYSHGVRLIGPTITINGESHSTLEVLRHPEWSRLISDEGVISNARAVRP